eukprot:756936-Hanusia_phi.AAC.3
MRKPFVPCAHRVIEEGGKLLLVEDQPPQPLGSMLKEWRPGGEEQEVVLGDEEADDALVEAASLAEPLDESEDVEEPGDGPGFEAEVCRKDEGSGGTLSEERLVAAVLGDVDPLTLADHGGDE